MKQLTNHQTWSARGVFAVALLASALAILAAFGALGNSASAAPTSAQYEYGGNGNIVLICLSVGKNRRVEILVDERTLVAFLARGATIGPCP